MPLDAAAARQPRPGVEEWRNPQNRMAVVQLHYTADPRKRTAAWKAQAQRGMRPRDWQREYEISWSAPEGEPVIPEYNGAIHRRPLQFDPQLRLLRFWDFGFDSPVVLFAQLALNDQLRILRELCPFNTSLAMLVPMVKALTIQMMGPSLLDDQMDVGGHEGFDPLGMSKAPKTAADRVFDAGDPEGNSQKSLGCEIEILQDLGIRIHTARPGTEESYQALRGRVARQVQAPRGGLEPAFVLDPAGCPMLHEALAGAFCRSTLPPYKPKKDHPFKDLVDAARYGNDNLASATGATWSLAQQAAKADRIDTIGGYW